MKRTITALLAILVAIGMMVTFTGGAAAQEDTQVAIAIADEDGTFTELDENQYEIVEDSENDRFFVVLSGETTVAPGSDIRVSIEDGDDVPFLMTDTVEVDEDGTFTATFDTSEQEVGQEFEATAGP